MATKKPDEDLDALMGDEPEMEAAPAARLHPILSDEDFLKAQAKAKSRIEAERRTAAMAEVEDREARRLRVEEGLVTGIGVMDELVDVSIDLPPWSPHISINGSFPGGRVYWHGQSYLVPRHVANTLNEMMFRAWRHEDQTDGRDITQQYARKLNSTINGRTGAVRNAPSVH